LTIVADCHQIRRLFSSFSLQNLFMIAPTSIETSSSLFAADCRHVTLFWGERNLFLNGKEKKNFLKI
jgi:hypothetical protein